MHKLLSRLAKVPAGTRTFCIVAALLAGAGLDLARTVDGSLPYVLHSDDEYLMNAARRILQTGDLNPHWYSYPNLPTYLAAASMGVGLVHASGKSSKALTVDSIADMSGAIYSPAGAVRSVRWLWICMALLAAAATAVYAFTLGGSGAAVISCIAVLVCPVWFAQAWSYANVDIPLTLFCTACLAQLLTRLEDTSFRERALLPGLLCGAAMASKYTGVLLLVPCLVAIWSQPTRDSVLQSVGLAACAFFAFALLSPYFLLDLPKSLDRLAFEIWHYRVRGHSGAQEAEPGAAQALAYLMDCVWYYGWAYAASAVVGAAVLIRDRPRIAAILSSFFGVWLIFWSNYKIHFPRNGLPMFLMVPVFGAVGLQYLHGAATLPLSRAMPKLTPMQVRIGAGAALALVVLVTAPCVSIIDRWFAPADTRNRFAAWAEQGLQRGAYVLIPKGFAYAGATLPDGVHLTTVDLSKPDDVSAWLRTVRKNPAYLILPAWDDHRAWLTNRVHKMQPGMDLLQPYQTVLHLEGEPAMLGRITRNPDFALVRLRR